MEPLEVRLVPASVSVVGGNLLITGDFGGMTDDVVTIQADSTTDPGNPIFIISDPGITTIPFALVTGQIIINTLDGNDSLTVDFSLGDFPNAIVFDGGGQTNGDSLLLIGGGVSVATVTHSFGSSKDSIEVVIGPTTSMLSYTGLEPFSTLLPVVDQLSVAQRVFSFSGVSEAITLQSGSNTDLTIESDTGESVGFTNPTGPTGSLTINAGAGADLVDIVSVNTGFAGSLTLNGGNGDDTLKASSFEGGAPFNGDVAINGDAGNDVVEWNATVTFINGRRLDVDLTNDAAVGDVDRIVVGNNAQFIAVGANRDGVPGLVDFRASRSIELLGNSRLQTDGGSLTLAANQGASGISGNFMGIALRGGAVVSSAAGNVTLKGRGGDGSAGQQIGVRLDGGSRVTGGGGGTTLTLDGIGGASGGNSNSGVQLEGGSSLGTMGGDVLVVGQGGGLGPSFMNHGIWLHPTGGQITAELSGTVTVNGTGGTASGVANNGVVWEGASSNITSAGGAILVTGTVISGPDNFAIAIHRDNVQLNPATTTLTAGTGIVLLRPETAGTMIDLGGADVAGTAGGPGSATLGLTDAELDLITAGQLLIGDPMSGTLTVTAPITLGTHLAITSGAGITVGQPITLAADKELRADVFGTTGLLQLTTVDADLSVSGAGTISISATTLDLVNGSSLATVDSGVFLKVNSINLAGTVNAGAGMVAIVGAAAGRAIDLGAVSNPAAGPLSLSDAELDSITAGSIDIGDPTSGAIAISSAINRSAATNLFLRTAPDNNISFLTSGSLDANGGDVSLFTDFGGTGAILGSAAAPNIRGNLLSLGAGSGGIGSGTTPVSFDAVSLRTMTGGNGSQFLREMNSVEFFGGVDGIGGLNAGSGTINLNGGTFVLGGSDRINDAADVAVAFGATLDLGPNNEAIDQLVLIDGGVTGNGTLTGSSTFDLRKGSISVNLAGASAAVGVSKTAPDTVTLSGANNSYSGGTTISSGTLALVSTASNNSIPNSPTISVQPGATLNVNGLDSVATADTLILADGQTLQGSGLVTGKLIAPNGATISPGTSPGILSSGSVNLQAGSALNIEVNGNVSGTGYDQLNVTGSVTLGDATLNLTGTIRSVPGQQIVIVNNDEADPVSGLFKNAGGTPLAEGATVTIAGVSFILTYAGGAGGNDVTLTQAGGTLTLLENTGAADLWSIRLVGGNVQVLNDGKIVDARPIAAGAAIAIVGENNQNDTLTLDFAAGNPIPAAGLSFVGGTAGNDSLVLMNVGAVFPTHTYNYTNANDGSVVLNDGNQNSAVSYTGLEPISNDGTATDIVFNLPTAASNGVLEDDGTAANGLSRLRSANGTFERTDFANPTGSLTINRGNAADTLTVNALPDFTADLTLGSAANPFGTVMFAGAVTLAANNSLAADASGTISFDSAASDLATSGGGTVTLTTQRGIAMTSGSSLQAVDGNVTLAANQSATPTAGNFTGISLDQATIRTTGTGSISLFGRSGNAANLQYGILLQNSSLIEATGSGEVDLSGESRGTSGPENDGIAIFSSADILTNTGQLRLQGIRGVGGTSEGIGVTDSGVTIATTNAPLFFLANVIHTGPSQPVITAGSGNTLFLRPITPGTAIGLGATSSSVFSLSDAQLDRMTAGTIQIGDANSGAITISNNITRPAATNLMLTAGGNDGVRFSGAGRLDANGGDVTISLNAAGSGGVISGTAATDIAADDLVITAGSGGIGASGNPLSTAVSNLEAIGGSGGINLLNTGDLTIGGIGATNGVSATNAAVSITAASSITVTEAIASGGGAVNLTATEHVTLSGANADVTTGGGVFTVSADSDANNTGQFTSDDAGSAVSTGAGDIAITAAEVALTGTLAGTNVLTLRPSTASRSIGIGGGTGDFNLSDTELTKLTNGFVSITIGDAANGTGAVDVDSSAFTDPLTIVGGSIAATELNAGSNAVTLTARTGAITDGGDVGTDVTGSAVTLNAASGTIGAAGDAISLAGSNLTTNTGTTNGNQDLTEVSGGINIAPGGLNAGTGTITLGGGAFMLAGSDRIQDTANVRVSGGATLALGVNSDTINQFILVNGNVVGAGTLTGTSTFDVRSGSVSASLAGSIGLTKATSDTVTLSGSNTFSGTTTVSDGRLNINGSTTSNTTVGSGGILGGTGTINSGNTLTVQSGGTVAPGTSPGILNSGSVTLQSGSAFNVELSGTTVGTQYDQLNVTGTVTIGSNVALIATLGFVPSAGDAFVIINNDGSDPITTTFFGHPQDSLLTIGGKPFHIVYNFNSGDGQANDVALIVNRLPVINSQNFAVNETATSGTVIGTVVATDADSAVTFAITAGNSSGTFALNGSSGQLTVNDPTGLANGSSFSLTVTVTDDADATATAQITISARGSAPVAPSDADTTNSNRNDGLVPEGAIPGTRVGITLSATDPQGDEVFYRLTDDAGGRFAVDPLTGVVTVKTGHLLNFANATEHTIRAQAVDANGNASPEMTFGIDVVEVPVNALPLASILPSRVSIVEGDPDDPGHRFISFLVKLNKPSTETVQIDFSTRVGDEPGFIRPDGIPADASFATDIVGPWDFFRSSGRLTFDPGVTEQTVRVQLRPDDDPVEMNELFFVQLDSPVNAQLAAGQSIAVAEILEDDSVPQVIVENAQVLEGAAPGQKELVFRLKLVGDFALGLTSATVDFATDDVPIDTATPDVDYTSVSGTLTFTEGGREQEVRIPITGDVDDETDETLSLRFTNAVGLGLSRNFAVGTIVDDDSAEVVVSITPSVSKVREGHSGTQQVELFVTLIGQPTTDVAVNYTTADHHATAGSDYVAASGTVTFTLGDIAAGLSQKSILITVNGDTDIELDEGFVVSLSLPTPLPEVSLDPSKSLARVVLRNDDQAILTEDADELFADLLADLVSILEAGGGAKNNPALVAEMQRRAVLIAQSLGLIRAIIIIIDPVDFVLTDPGDRQSGYTEDTGSVNQIPGTYYSGDGAVELLIIPLPPDGTYNVQLAGLGGDFNASVTILNGNNTTSGVVSDFSGQFFQNGDLAVQFGEGRIPLGLGLAAAHSGAASSFGVVGAFGQAEFRLALASALEQARSEGLDPDEADSRSTGLMFWLSVSARVLRQRVIEPLWQSLGTPLDGLLGEGGFTRIAIPSELVDQFWSQVGQTLTGVPSGIYRLGNMLESVIPTLVPRRVRSAPPRSGDQGQPNSAPGNNGVRTRRSSLERPRVAPPNGQVQPPSKPNATKDKSAQTPDSKKVDGQQASTPHTRWLWFTFKDEKSTAMPSTQAKSTNHS